MFYAAFQSTKYREKGETSQIKQCKQQRNFQLLTAGTFTPNWSVTIREQALYEDEEFGRIYLIGCERNLQRKTYNCSIPR